MTDLLIDLVAAARPNFMKIAPLHKALQAERWCDVRFIHTGQHYAPEMSDMILQDLGLPAPDVHLGIGPGTHAEQTASVLVAYERVCIETRPSWSVVVGDVNSTMASALAAAKLDIPVAHLEAGLRSRDFSMPEEVNRIVTDSVSRLLLAPSQDAVENLVNEGHPSERIEMVGNIMIDSLEMLRAKIFTSDDPAPPFGVVTLHRPSNVDDAQVLKRLVGALVSVSRRLPLLFPVHPRTEARLIAADLWDNLVRAPAITLSGPLGYVEFMQAVVRSRLVITDSGGVQEETTYLGIPCLTMRPNTERPITIAKGTNRLTTVDELEAATDAALDEKAVSSHTAPPLWDGRTAQRVATILRRVAGERTTLET